NLGTNGAPVQNFSSSYDSYDNEAADDFVVPAGGWTINSINMGTTNTGSFAGATPVAINIYPDAGGLPGTTAACSYPAAPSTVTASSTTITLPSSCALAAGTYWLAVAVDFNFVTQG